MIRRVYRGTLALAVLLTAAGSVLGQPSELPATVVTLTGKAEIYRKGDTKWTPADLRDTLREGDGIRTSPSVRTTLRTGGGNSIRLAALTQLFIVPPLGGATDPLTVHARLDRGWLWVAVAPGAYAKAPIEVVAGPARVDVRGGVGFRINRDGSVIVRTYHGDAVVHSSDPAAGWVRSLPEAQELLVPAGSPLPPNRPLSREEAEAPWVLWNEEQDYVAYGGKAPQQR